MSDQQDMSDIDGSDAHPHPQEQEIEVVGLDSMRVKVTNIVDGIFQFARARSSGGGWSSASAGEYATPNGTPSNSRPSSPTKGLTGGGGGSGSGTDRPKIVRGSSSTKKVKFRDPHPPAQPKAETTTAGSSSGGTAQSSTKPLNAETAEDNSSDDNIRNERKRGDGYMADDSDFDSSDNNNGSRSRRMNSNRTTSSSSFHDNSTSRSSRRRLRMDSSSASARRDYHPAGGNDMDASSGSQASWNVTLAEQDNPQGGDGDEDEQKKERKWFEKYMPDWIRVIRAWCGTVVLNDIFQIVMVLLIVANSLCMGLATFDFIYDDPELNEIFNRVDQGFLIIFTVELALQFGYWGYQLFYDGWLLFDFVTVVSSWMLEGVQVFRSIRIFRAFRLVVRIPILKSLVYAVLHVIPRISSIMGLFCLLIYIFAVMATTLYSDFYERGITDEDYFGRLDRSLFTLFQFVTLEGWADVVRAIMAVDPFAKYIFGLYLTVSGFILYSLVVAVVCDSFLSVEAKIRNELKEQAKLERERRKALRRAKKQKNKRNLFDGVDDSGVDFGSSTNLMDDSSSRRSSSGSRRSSKGRKEHSPPVWKSPVQTDTADGKGKGMFSRGMFDASQGTPPPLSTTSRQSRRKSFLDRSETPRFGPGNEIQARRNNTGSTAIDDDDSSIDLLSMEHQHHTPVAFKTLASGGMERKNKRGGDGGGSSGPGKKKKKRPVKSRIKRVQYRLNKLTKTQSEILNTLDEMCKEMDRDRDDSQPP